MPIFQLGEKPVIPVVCFDAVVKTQPLQLSRQEWWLQRCLRHHRPLFQQSARQAVAHDELW
jgi:hypothetical protein